MIAPYIAIAATRARSTRPRLRSRPRPRSSPAAARSRGFLLRWWIAYQLVLTVALKLIWLQWHVYDPLWRAAEPIGMILLAAAVLKLTTPRRWPVYGIAALVVHCWAAGYPNRWPGTWLQAEIHIMAFCYLALGLVCLSGVARNATTRTCKESLHVAWTLAAMLLGTAAAYYTAPWHPEVRAWLMWFESACFLALALPTSVSLAARLCRSEYPSM